MKWLNQTLIIVALCNMSALPGFALAQSSGDLERLPATPDAARALPAPMSPTTPTDRGMIVVPPAIDPQAVETPRKNIDPGIDDITDDIDQKNASKAVDKAAAETGNKTTDHGAPTKPSAKAAKTADRKADK